MKRIFFIISALILTVCIVFSLAIYCRNVHYISIEKFEEKTSDYTFLPKAAELGANLSCKGRIVTKGLIFKRSFYELFVEYDNENDFLSQQVRINETYTYEDVNVKGVFGGLIDHIVCEKDGFQYRIADIEDGWGYPDKFLLIGQSQENKEFVFVVVDDPHGGSIDDWDDYLKNEMYI